MTKNLHAVFRTPWPLIGVLHLPALPGSPGARLTMSEIRDYVLSDAEVLARSGFEGMIFENFGDHPFCPDDVEPHTIAAMSLITGQVMSAIQTLRPAQPVAFGINVLRNDARAAMAIASVCGAQFIRVNVHCGAMVTDQGIIQGKAHQTLRYRRSLGTSVAVFADVLVKHAYPLGPVELEAIARDTFSRGGAAALIVSGRGTGEPADLEQAARIRRVLPAAPILVGSGLTLESLPAAMRATNGAIVGTSLKKQSQVDQPIEAERALAFVEASNRLLEASR